MVRRILALHYRPTSTEGFWGWFNTIDHKKIGVLYGVTGFLFFLLGGVEALLVRLQLARPESTLLSADRGRGFARAPSTTPRVPVAAGA